MSDPDLCHNHLRGALLDPRDRSSASANGATAKSIWLADGVE